MKLTMCRYFRNIYCIIAMFLFAGCDNVQQVQINQLDSFARFGRDIDVSGVNAIIGAYQEYRDGDEGAAYIFVRRNNTWSVQARLESPTPGDEEFGDAVSIFESFAAVGAPMDHQPGAFRSGSVHIYQRTNVAEWNHIQSLSSPLPHQPWELYGTALAMDSALLAVAAVARDESQATDAGVVFVYEYAAGAYSLIDTLTIPSPASYDNFGSEISIKGSTITVSAFNRDSRIGANTGQVYVFERNRGNFDLVQTLSASNPATDMRFGTGLDLFEQNDGARRIVVGASGAGVGGAAYVFDAPPGGSFTQTEILTPSDGSAGDSFGTEAVLWDNSILVGATGADTTVSGAGAVYSFQFDGTVWQEETKIEHPYVSSNDSLGASLGLAEEYGLAGATEVELDDNLTSTGAAYAFRRQSSGGWTYGHLLHPQGGAGLTVDQGGEDMRFGKRISISGDQIFIVHQRGSDMFVKTSDGFSLDQTFEVNPSAIHPHTLAVSNDTAAVFAQRRNTVPNGVIDVYTKQSDEWILQEQLEPDLEGGFPFEAAYRSELVLQGDTLVAAAPHWKVTEGRVFVYERSGNTWGAPQIIQAPESQVEHAFGRRVALDGDWLAVSKVPVAGNPAFQRHGRVHIYLRTEGQFVHQQELTAPNIANFDGFGQNLDLDGDLIAVVGGNPDTIRVYARQGLVYTEIWNEPGSSNIALHNNFLAIARNSTIHIYERQLDDSFVEVETYRAPDEAANSALGSWIDFDDEHVVASANPYSDKEKVYIFNR